MGVSIVVRSGVILFINIYLYYRWVPSVYETNGFAKALCITLYSLSLCLLGTIVLDLGSSLY